MATANSVAILLPALKGFGLFLVVAAMWSQLGGPLA